MTYHRNHQGGLDCYYTTPSRAFFFQTDTSDSILYLIGLTVSIYYLSQLYSDTSWTFGHLKLQFSIVEFVALAFHMEQMWELLFISSFFWGREGYLCYGFHCQGFGYV